MMLATDKYFKYWVCYIIVLKKGYGEDYILGYEVGNLESYILDCDIDYGAGYWVVIDWCKNRDKLFRVSIDTLNIYCLVKHYIRYICTTSTRDYHTITAAGKQSYFCWTESDSLPPLCFFGQAYNNIIPLTKTFYIIHKSSDSTNLLHTFMLILFCLYSVCSPS